ncbi:hypothetical protein M0R45_037338 [Rubus argutus]|uniref:Uncharacterized protein n=1 Tax=Rubus argutus TaxID=59490 RepID=A0AAW1W465_RUBAR
MAVQVLSPHDCLKNPSTSRQALFPPLMKYQPKPKPKPNPNPNPNRAIHAHPVDQKQQMPSRSININSLPARSAVQKIPVAKNQLIGQVKILKRGEELPKPAAPHQPSYASKENRSSPQKVQDLSFKELLKLLRLNLS